LACGNSTNEPVAIAQRLHALGGNRQQVRDVLGRAHPPRPRKSLSNNG
jgi:hypothetical protein